MARFTAAPAATLAKARQAREYLKQHLLDKGVLVFMDYNTRKQAMRIKLYGYAVPERMEKLKPLGFVISQASGFGATVYINEEGVICPTPCESSNVLSGLTACGLKLRLSAISLIAHTAGMSCNSGRPLCPAPLNLKLQATSLAIGR